MSLCIAYVATALALDRVGARAQPSGRYDAIVVAGAGVLADGAPSRPLAARVRLAVELYRRGVAPVIVMTGGVGRNPPAESVVATRLAHGLGVPEAAILREERSTSTEENADEARRLLGDARVLVVTDRFHVFRARRVFARRFTRVDAVGCVSAPGPRVRGALREVLALASYALLGRL